MQFPSSSEQLTRISQCLSVDAKVNFGLIAIVLLNFKIEKSNKSLFGILNFFSVYGVQEMEIDFLYDMLFIVIIDIVFQDL